MMRPKHREFQLLVGGAEVDEQIVNFVEHFVGAGVLAVNLVDDDHHGQAGLKGLAQHETGLRQRPFRGVHQQDRAAGHGKGALHFATEVGVAGSIDNVDFYALPVDGAVLGRNGDTAFTFQIHAVHDAVIHLLIVAKDARLLEKTIHESGFAVIDVSDDRHVAKVIILLHPL